MKWAIMSNCKDTSHRSKKDCVCGGHSQKARKKRKPLRETIRRTPHADDK